MSMPDVSSITSWRPTFPQWVQDLKKQLPLEQWQEHQKAAKAENQFKRTVTWIGDNRLALGAGLTSVILLQPMLSPYRAKALLRNVVFLGGAGFCVLCPAEALALGRVIKRDVLLDSAIAAFPPLQKLSLRWPQPAEELGDD